MRYQFRFIIEVGILVLLVSGAMAQSQPPVISNVEVPRVTGYDAMITWETDEPSSSVVRYGISAQSLTDVVMQANLVTQHQIGLADLEPLTNYFFEVASGDADGAESVDNRGDLFYYFKTTDFNPRVIVIDSNAFRILEYDPSVGTSQRLAGANNIQYVRYVAIDVDGNLYFSIYSPGRIYKTDSHGENIYVIPPWSKPNIPYPRGLAFNSDGNLLITAGSTILEYTRSGEFVRTFASGLSGAVYIAVNRLGHVFISQSSEVLEFDPDGNPVGTFADASDGLQSAKGLDFDREGNLYVASTDGIYVFDSDGAVIRVLSGEDFLYYPRGIALMPNGNLLVCHQWREGLCALDSQGNLVKRKGTWHKYDWLDYPDYWPYDVAVYGGVDLTFTRGYVVLDREVYNCAQRVGITLADADLKGAGRATAWIKSTSEPAPEIVPLYEEADQPGVFRGWILTTTGTPTSDGLLQVSDGDTIQVEYLDEDDGKGSSRLAHATATVECDVPQVSDVQVTDIGEDEATISWQTDEPSNSVVYYGLSQAALTESAYLVPATNWHSTELSHLKPNTAYYYAVASRDASGGVGTADNDGELFTFITSLTFDKFSDDVEEPVQGWIAEGTWARSNEQSHSPSYAWSDSPGGDYANNTEVSLISPIIDVADMLTKEMSFFHHHDLEYGFDYGYVEISKDNGQTWSLPILTVTGSNSSFEQVVLDLSRYHAPRLRVRFRLSTDSSFTADGWYIDDIRLQGTINTLTDNLATSYGFEIDTEGWQSLAVPQVFTAPVFSSGPGYLGITSVDNTHTFGLWQSDENAVPIIPGALYRVAYRVSTDVEDAAQVPTLRFRASTQDNQQSSFLIVNSGASGQYSPTPEGKTYELYFEPSPKKFGARESADDFFVAMDLLNFDPNDAAQATVRLEQLSVERFPLSWLRNVGEVRHYSFDTGAEGWQFSSVPTVFTPPQSGVGDGALQLTSTTNTNTFGSWVSPRPPELMWIEVPEILFRGTFVVRSNQTDRSRVPPLRVCMITGDVLEVAGQVVTSTGTGEWSPSTAPEVYRVYYKSHGFGAPVTQEWIDLLSFDANDAVGATLYLDHVTLETLDVPTIP